MKIIFILSLLSITLLGCGGNKNPSEIGSSEASSSTTESSSTVSSSSSSQDTSSQDTSSQSISSQGIVRLAPNNIDILRSEFCMTPTSSGASSTFQFEREVLETALLNDGLEGNIHGNTLINQQYVFTYRTNNFFEFEHISLVPATANIATALAQTKRHDRINIVGTLLMTGTQRHILVENLTIIERYANAYQYNHRADESAFEAIERAKVFGKVHALIGSGEGIVLEYEDMVLPVIVDASQQALVSTLFRNDIVLVDLKVERSPNRPLHFRVDTDQNSPITIIDRMVNCHTQIATLTGKLIRFPPSPQISREVYAIQVKDDNGIIRNYTFFPDVDFSQPTANDQFTSLLNAISDKSRRSWKASIENVQDGRNYFINPRIDVSVSGRINVTSPNQANPQIYISDPNQLLFQVTP